MDTQKILDNIKNYQRPVRMIMWVLCISVSYMMAVMGINKNPIDVSLTQTILYGMFIDLGVYGVARTIEKNVQAKIDGGNPITNINKTIISTTDDIPGSN